MRAASRPGAARGKSKLDARWRLNSLADAWKMRPMSAVRLCLARLAPLLALAALSLVAACTAPTPQYCDNDERRQVRRPRLLLRHADVHTCKPADAAVDANDASATGDAPADQPTDSGTERRSPGRHRRGVRRGDAADAAPTSSTAASTTAAACRPDQAGLPDRRRRLRRLPRRTATAPRAGARACDTAANKCVECVVNSDCADPHQAGLRQPGLPRLQGRQRMRRHRPRRLHVPPRRPLRDRLARRSTSRPATPSAPTRDRHAGTSQVRSAPRKPAIDATAQPAPPPRTDAGTDNADAGNGDGRGADSGPGSDAGTVPASPRPLVVMRGGSLTEWSFNDAGRTLTVVGQLERDAIARRPYRHPRQRRNRLRAEPARHRRRNGSAGDRRRTAASCTSIDAPSTTTARVAFRSTAPDSTSRTA